MIKDLIVKNRTTRRFDQSRPIEMETLRELVDCARLSPSARNGQVLRYVISCDPERNTLIFPHLAWAGYLKDWDGPKEGERPAAYIVICTDRAEVEGSKIDQGIACQSMLLAAVERGLAGCVVASVKRVELAKLLDLPENMAIQLVLALGVPVEKVVIDPLPADGDIRYWRDEAEVHHVPKRALDDLILP